MKLILTLVLLVIVDSINSQDCSSYWNLCHNDSINNYHDHYQLVVNDRGQNVSKSSFISIKETLEIEFQLFSGRDYRMSICTSYENKPIIRIYELGTTNLIYDNTTNDTIEVFEYEQRFNMKVKAIVSLFYKENKNKKNYLLEEKPKRYCIGFKLESMITRK